ncbi:MAG: hypothetical protein ACKOD2_13475, partial [Ilumatobacteraceae bacterium]
APQLRAECVVSVGGPPRNWHVGDLAQGSSVAVPVPTSSVIRLDAATVLLQWASGGMLFCWFTTRRREVGLGYGWLLRGVYLLLAAGAVVTGFRYGRVWVREIASIVVGAAILGGLVSSIVRRRAGVSGQRSEFDERSDEIAAQTGIERSVRASTLGSDAAPPREFHPAWDLVAPIIAVVGLVAAGLDAGGNDAVAILRTLVGAVFLGAITDAMLLGHWYLVQPGLPRRLLNEIVSALIFLWPLEVVVMLLPTGMVSVLSGAVDDGWNGTLGWIWLACTVSTIALVIVTQLALRERYYSAVMAATGLLYLAILTSFGMDLVARAVLS